MVGHYLAERCLHDAYDAFFIFFIFIHPHTTPSHHSKSITCKLLNPLTGVLIALFIDDIVDICVNGMTFNCNGESSGLLVGVTANVPTQLPLIDEFDNDEFDSDKEFRRPYISGTFIDSPRDYGWEEKKTHNKLVENDTLVESIIINKCYRPSNCPMTIELLDVIIIMISCAQITLDIDANDISQLCFLYSLKLFYSTMSAVIRLLSPSSQATCCSNSICYTI